MVKGKVQPVTHRICLCINMCDVLSDNGAELLVGAVFSLFLSEVSGCMSRDVTGGLLVLITLPVITRSVLRTRGNSGQQHIITLHYQ